MDLLQGTKVSGNAVVGVMAPQRGVESVDHPEIVSGTPPRFIEAPEKI
jgi:hypothetical protein